jgi:hypothetical protein
MRIREMAAAMLVVFVLVPGAARAQGTGPSFGGTAADSGDERFSFHFGGGPTVRGNGGVLSAAFGFSPASRVDLLVTVERDHLPFQRTFFERGYGVTRGGTMTFVSGELRASLRPKNRVSPLLLAGAGGGISRPTVNAQFPNVVKNDLRVAYVGGGVRVPLRGGLSVVADARAMLALEGDDSVIALWPVRAGVAWRF